MNELPRNKLIENLLRLKAGEVHRDKSVKDLILNLKELQLKIDLINLSNQSHAHEGLKSNCDLVKNQISLQSEKAKNRVDFLCDELKTQVDAIEKEWMTAITVACWRDKMLTLLECYLCSNANLI